MLRRRKLKREQAYLARREQVATIAAMKRRELTGSPLLAPLRRP